MIGESVYIKEGPFAGKTGSVVAKSPNGKYFVKLSRGTIVSFEENDFTVLHKNEEVPADGFNKVLNVVILFWVAVFLVIYYLWT